MEKKDLLVELVQPIFSMRNEDKDDRWNYSELEKLEKRCSELIDQNRKSKSMEYFHQDLIKRFESIYSSLACQIFISPCFIRFYQITDIDICSFQQWKYLHQGYPMWIFNNGSNYRREGELRLSIIDHRTGFILWSDQITQQSNFISTNHQILSFRHSKFHSFQMIRFQLVNEQLFDEFLCFYREKQNFLFFDNKCSKKKFLEKRRIKKSEISLPTDFHHWNHFQ